MKIICWLIFGSLFIGEYEQLRVELFAHDSYPGLVAFSTLFFFTGTPVLCINCPRILLWSVEVNLVPNFPSRQKLLVLNFHKTALGHSPAKAREVHRDLPWACIFFGVLE